MREGKPSFTAACVAAARGLRGVDPLAGSLVGGPLGVLVRAGAGGGLRGGLLNLSTLGLLDHVEMRTRAIDAAVRDAVGAGLRQVVVLGAGLDARAFRMPELREARVYEVDHPASQAYKRARAEAQRPAARHLTFVPVDFEEDALGEALAKAGHDPAAPTLWLWEGVTPYLGLAALRATLAAVSARSAPGSRMLVTYLTTLGSPLGARFVRFAGVVFRGFGESIEGMYTPRSMREELGAAGFRVTDDASAEDWGARFGRGRRLLLLIDERLADAAREVEVRASA